MPKLRYVMALICYLAIPLVVIVGVGLSLLIDPEMARGHVDYARHYRWLDVARASGLIATAALALLLWVACCYLVLESRQRSRGWLALAAAGPLGFSVIGALEDRSPRPGDLYQRFIKSLKSSWRAALELAVFVSVWIVAYEAIVFKRDLMISVESFRTGTPTSTIIAQQSASSGMWAAGEGFEVMYLVTLIYLLWPIAFNLVAHVFKSR
jgi:hypothetical protein